MIAVNAPCRPQGFGDVLPSKQTQKLNLNQHSTLITGHRACHCVQLLHTVQHSSDDFPCYPPEKHHSSDDVCWRIWGWHKGSHSCSIRSLRWMKERLGQADKSLCHLSPEVLFQIKWRNTTEMEPAAVKIEVDRLMMLKCCGNCTLMIFDR